MAAPPSGPSTPCAKIDLGAGERALERAQPFMEAVRREEHPKQEVWDKGMADLEEAARNGQLEGQFRFGNTLFGSLFTDHAPEAKDETAYVRALAFLRVAARRGHPSVLRSYPGLESEKLAGTRFETPLDAVPRPWLAQAFERGDRWLACAGPEAKSRYVAGPSPKARTELARTDSGWTRRGEPEGPLVRLGEEWNSGGAAGEKLSEHLVGAMPELYDCYAAALGRDDKASAELVLLVALPDKKIEISGSSDAELASCIHTALGALELGSDTTKSRLELGLYPRALSAPELAEPLEGRYERRELDGSCWIVETPPCAPRKMCMAPIHVRVRCPTRSE